MTIQRVSIFNRPWWRAWRRVVAADADGFALGPRLSFPVGVRRFIFLNARTIQGIAATYFDRQSRVCYVLNLSILPEYRGYGWGARADALLTEYVFMQMGAAKLTCEVLASNKVSTHMQADGMRLEGRLRHHIRVDGVTVDLLLFGLTNGEWRCQQREIGNALSYDDGFSDLNGKSVSPADGRLLT